MRTILRCLRKCFINSGSKKCYRYIMVTYLKMLWIMMVSGVVMAEEQRDPARDQIVYFKERTPGPIGTLTTTSGAPVCYEEATCTLNTRLLDNNFLMDSVTHLNRERIPERIVHAKGIGAFGYFVVTRDITHICSAKFLNQIGKRTPLAVRFSSIVAERGGSDLNPDGRGFAMKFYTEDGNFDLVGFNTPMYTYNDPLQFRELVHAFKRNPETNLFDWTAVWDLFTKNPHSLHIFILIFSGRGVPISYGNMPGFSLHTYQVGNECGDRNFVRFHMLPDDGIKNFDTKVASNISATDADYLTKELYQKIANGEFPWWTIYVQVIPEADAVKKATRIFDVTRVIPLDDYPLQEVGKFVLNRNPKNYHAEVEQMAFCPANLVDGIVGAPDKLFQSRRFAYRDAQFYRLGANFNKITINCPFQAKAYTYNRDGVPPVNDNEGDAPNYYPNSFHGPVPYTDKKRSTLIKIKEKQAYNFDQAAELYANELTPKERDQLIENLSTTLLQATILLRDKAIETLTLIHPNLGYRVARAVNATVYK